MPNGWRAIAGLAVAAAMLAPMAGDAIGAARDHRVMLVSDGSGSVLLRLPLGDEAGFRLQYRNSIYRSPAEERFAVTPDGRMQLVGLAARELAVLEEYYIIEGPARRDPHGLGWKSTPSEPLVLERLQVAATDLGERTLLIDGQPPVQLWRLVDDRSPSVLLEVASGR